MGTTVGVCQQIQTFVSTIYNLDWHEKYVFIPQLHSEKINKGTYYLDVYLFHILAITSCTY